jgi:archaellum component FlaC
MVAFFANSFRERIDVIEEAYNEGKPFEAIQEEVSRLDRRVEMLRSVFWTLSEDEPDES